MSAHEIKLVLRWNLPGCRRKLPSAPPYYPFPRSDVFNWRPGPSNGLQFFHRTLGGCPFYRHLSHLIFKTLILLVSSTFFARLARPYSRTVQGLMPQAPFFTPLVLDPNLDVVVFGTGPPPFCLPVAPGLERTVVLVPSPGRGFLLLTRLDMTPNERCVHLFFHGIAVSSSPFVFSREFFPRLLLGPARGPRAGTPQSRPRHIFGLCCLCLFLQFTMPIVRYALISPSQSPPALPLPPSFACSSLVFLPFRSPFFFFFRHDASYLPLRSSLSV